MVDLIERLEKIKTFFVSDYGYDQATTVDEAAATITALRDRVAEVERERDEIAAENLRYERHVKDLSDEIDNLEEEGCGVDDTIRKLSDRATAAEAAIARLRDEVIEAQSEAYDEAASLAIPVYGFDDAGVVAGIVRYREQLTLKAAALRALKSNRDTHHETR